MKIIISAFEPFDNNKINYSQQVLQLIDEDLGVIKISLPVLYYQSFAILKQFIIQHQPDYVILLGEARNYQGVGFEVIGINELGKKADSNLNVYNHRYIIENGPDGIFSSLEHDLFKKAMDLANVKSFRSFSAGTYVCNALLYQTLNFVITSKQKIKVGFIHIPDLNNHDQNSFNLKTVVQGLNIYLKVLQNK